MSTLTSGPARVLVVDDEPLNARILARALENDYLVEAVSDGASALRAARAEPRPDMILLDVLMPGMDGFTVYGELARDARTSRIPVVFVTALDDQVNEEQGLQLGAVDYIHKPINPAVVRARVSMHLELERHRALLGRLLERRTEDLASAEQEARAALISLEQSEETFRNLVDGSIQGVVIHREGVPLFVNPAYAQILGYDAPADVYALGSIDATIPFDERERLRSARHSGIPSRYEHAALRRDGRRIVVETVTSATTWHGAPASQATIVDVTERARAEQELRESRERFRDFAEASSDWFWEMDENLQFTHITDRAATSLNLDGLQALNLAREGGGIPSDFARDPRKWQRLWSDLEHRRPFRGFEFPIRDEGGRLLFLRAGAKPIFDGTRFLGYRGVASDVTGIVRSQRQANMLRDAIDVSRDGVALYDRNLRMVFTNDQFHRIFPSAPSKSAIVGMTREDAVRATTRDPAVPLPVGYASADEFRDAILRTDPRDETDVAELSFAGGHTFLRRHRPLADGSVMVLWNDITEQKAAADEVARSRDELQRLAAEVALTAERERRAIASELHDGAVQNLGLARIKLGTLRNRLPEGDEREHLDEVRRLLDASIAEVRSLMSELSPPMLYELGLDPALEWLADRFAERHALDCALVLEGDAEDLPGEVEISLFQAVRELLVNVVKHAGATRVVVTRRIDARRIGVCVADDGVGIDSARLEAPPSDAGGFGLFSLRERMGILGGEMTVEADAGTRITLTVPRAR